MRKSCLTLLSMLGGLTLAAAVSLEHDGANPVVKAGNLTFKLAAKKDGMGLVSMKNAAGVEFVKAPRKEKYARLWRVKLTPDHKNKKLLKTVNNCTACKKTSAVCDGKSVKLTWLGVKLPNEKSTLDVIVTISEDRATGMSDWRIKVTNNSNSYGIFQVYSPDIDFGYIKDEGKNDFLLLNPADGRLVTDPINWAINSQLEKEKFMLTTDGYVDVDMKGTSGFGFGACEPYGLPYPGDRGQMQFAAYYHKDGNFYYASKEKGYGIYLATHDSDFNPKVTFASPWPKDKRLNYTMAHYPAENCAKGLSFEQKYPMLIGAFEGDWYDAAMIYRKFAENAPWLKMGKLCDRKDVPDYFKQMTAVLRLQNRQIGTEYFDQNVRVAEFFRKHISGPIGIHWYAWNDNLFEKGPLDCGCFPATSAAKEGFKEAISQLNKSNIHTFPYVNIRLWSIGGNMKYVHDVKEAEPYFEESILGKRNTWEADDGSKWIHVCVFTKYWRDFLVKVYTEIAQNLEVEGFYADQGGGLCFAGGFYDDQGCFDKRHNHKVGVNRDMVIAERARMQAMVDGCRKVKPQSFFIGEGSSEAFIDLIPARLIHYEIWPGHVPSFSAVYHDYTGSFGRTVQLKSEHGNDPIPIMQMGWLLNSGNQLGRLRPAPEKHPEVIKYLPYLEKATAIKHQYSDFLNLGRMLRQPELVTPVEDILTREFSKINNICAFPGILASAWRAQDGRTGFLATNLTDKAQKVMFRFDGKDYNVAAGCKMKDNNGRVIIPQKDGEKLAFEVEIAPRDVIFWVFEK